MAGDKDKRKLRETKAAEMGNDPESAAKLQQIGASVVEQAVNKMKQDGKISLAGVQTIVMQISLKEVLGKFGTQSASTSGASGSTKVKPVLL